LKATNLALPQNGATALWRARVQVRSIQSWCFHHYCTIAVVFDFIRWPESRSSARLAGCEPCRASGASLFLGFTHHGQL